MIEAETTMYPRVGSSPLDSAAHRAEADSFVGGRNRTALIAARIVRTLAPSSVIDIGEDDALARRMAGLGVKTEHVSASALAGNEKIPGGHWDVVTCLGILERLDPEQSEQLLEQISAATDTAIVSCGPAAYFAPTTPGIRPPAAWAAAFAERGFYRRTDLDFEFAGPWTVVFERGTPTVRDVVFRYEQSLATAMADLSDRSARFSRGAQGPFSQDPDVAELQSQLASLRHQLLVSRDAAIGQEAQVAQLLGEADTLRGRLDEVYRSNTWRMGSRLARPVGGLKRALGSRG